MGSASQVQIVNMSLQKFGNLTITSISEATVQARAASVLWDIILRELLYSYPWKFALKRDTLETPSATEPEFEDCYKYTLPSDGLRVFNCYDMDADEWTVEGGELYCNVEEDVYIQYIAEITDVSLFSPAFVTTFSLRMASELCPKLSDNKNLRQALMQEYELAISHAYKLNAIEGQPARHKDEQTLDKGNLSWQTEGR